MNLKILILCNLFFSTLSAGYILDMLLEKHKIAHEDLKKHKTDIHIQRSLNYRPGFGNNPGSFDETIIYEFDSKDAKNSFKNYKQIFRAINAHLLLQTTHESILWGSILGYMHWLCKNFPGWQNNEKYTLYGALLLPILRILYTNRKMSPEPYFSTSSMREYKNLFKNNNSITVSRILFSLVVSCIGYYGMHTIINKLFKYLPVPPDMLFYQPYGYAGVYYKRF